MTLAVDWAIKPQHKQTNKQTASYAVIMIRDRKAVENPAQIDQHPA